MAIAIRIGIAPLGDVVLGPGEADVGVLALSGGGVLGLGVDQMTLLQLRASLQGSPQTTRKPIRKE